MSRPEIDFGLASFGPFRSGSPAVAKIGRRPMNILAMVRAESRYVFVSFSFPAPPSPLPRARPDEIGTVSVFDQSGIALVHEGLFRVARLANGGDQVASRRRHGARHHRLVNLPLMARLFLAQVVDVVLGRRLRVQRNGVDAPPIADVGRRRRRRARRRRRSIPRKSRVLLLLKLSRTHGGRGGAAAAPDPESRRSQTRAPVRSRTLVPVSIWRISVCCTVLSSVVVRSMAVSVLVLW